MAAVANADLLIIMSDIDGLYDSDPHLYPDAKLIDEVSEINDSIKSIAGGSGSSLGTGGMLTKIKAAQIACDAGIDMIIMNGSEPEKLYDLLLESKKTGTLFRAKNLKENFG
ncbi:Glutamate 5-kinase [bioreactor metagenome]|uniref:Glutamate 5-kinase n=1 Tax=bioreactor metagenome TaxID=1076179 RepID=A0A645I4S6_9ZZZZ